MTENSDALAGVIVKLREMRDLIDSGACLNDRRERLIQELISLCHRFVGLLPIAGRKELNRRSNILAEEIKQDGFDRVRKGSLAELELIFSGFDEGEQKSQSEYIWDENRNQLAQVVAAVPGVHRYESCISDAGPRGISCTF